MKATQLRQSILQAAVQGKLVPQNVYDEPASELLERIRQEKGRLVKEGKIKKEKPLQPITEDEIPYDLPDGWVWCRLHEVCDVRDGTHDTPKYVHNGIPLITSKNLKSGTVSFDNVKHISITDHNEISKRSGVDTGDILFAMIGSIGNPVVIGDETNFSIKNVALFKCLNRAIYDNTYVFLFLRATEQIMRDTSSGGVQSFVSLNYLRNYLISLPPLAEQQRIVAKADELMALCEALEAAEKKLGALESRFAEYLPKSILQAAVQGKLTPQNVHDEPASELLKRIQQEKARLIREGKIKKAKPLPPITEDEIPYDLPDGWVWCRLGNICDYGSAINAEPDAISNGAWILELEDIEKDTGKLSEVILKKNRVCKSTKHVFKKGNVLYSKLRPYLNKVIIAEADGYCTSEILPLDFGEMDPNYVVWVLRSPFFVEYANRCSYGVKMPRLGTEDGRMALFPLPPLAEQQRIVAKVDRLMALCDELKAAKDIPVKQTASKVIPFPQLGGDEPEIGIAARGKMQEISAEAARDIREMFGDDGNA